MAEIESIEAKQIGKEVIRLGDSITRNMERFADNYLEFFPASTYLDHVDDILVCGIEEHDQCLEQVLDRAKEIGWTPSANKCEFRQTEITYLEETLT